MVWAKEKYTYEVVNMLGARIGELRRRAGMSQSELAKRLKVSPSAVGMYEQGRREPSSDILVAMARVLGVTVDYLLTGVPDTQSGDKLAAMLMERIQTADQKMEQRTCRPFSRDELIVLFAAMLMEP
jgi:transcriptional regulator with XRE-family HTH domain